MRNIVNEHHLIRRILIGAITFCFLKVTLNIFSGNIDVTTGIGVAYATFCGLETLIVKYYIQSRTDEDKE